MRSIAANLTRLEKKIRYFGNTPGLPDHEKRKLGIFNQMNLSFGLILGVLVPSLAWLHGSNFSSYGWCYLVLAPATVCTIVLFIVGKGRYESARICFFFLHPVILSGSRIFHIDIGMDLFLICFGVLSLFFLKSGNLIIFSFSLSMTCYFITNSLGKEQTPGLNGAANDLEVFNQLIAIFFIFYGIFLIRNENNRYQLQIVAKNRRLHNSYLKIMAQEKALSERAALLEDQSIQLQDLNSMKNTLFSVVAHDLRGPIHALHNLFRNMESYNLPGEELKVLIPDLAKDLAKTTTHIESLLEWAKSQMRSGSLAPQVIEVSKACQEVLGFLRLQAEAKKLRVEINIERPVYVWADSGMIHVVLRNLLSNAIKYTPEEGTITLIVLEKQSGIQIAVQDSGIGIAEEDMKRIADGTGYTMPGTANEPGTGLGLMLCREYLTRNGGRLNIESHPGKGSVFSFTLPKAG